MENRLIDKINTNLVAYNTALIDLEAICNNSKDLKEKLSNAKSKTAAAESALNKAYKEKANALSIEDVSNANRVVDLLTSKLNDATALASNLNQALAQAPALETAARRQVEKCKAAAFSSYAEEIITQMKELPEFKTIIECIKESFMAENSANPGISYYVFLEKIIGTQSSCYANGSFEKMISKFCFKP